ncbi:MAG: hypothetical protein UD936_06995, partial [Acutalibacteraceae bacterium]|nr:hypothetical protein [Acutalibacteraceae bacterium]
MGDSALTIAGNANTDNSVMGIIIRNLHKPAVKISLIVVLLLLLLLLFVKRKAHKKAKLQTIAQTQGTLNTPKDLTAGTAPELTLDFDLTTEADSNSFIKEDSAENSDGASTEETLNKASEE